MKFVNIIILLLRKRTAYGKIKIRFWERGDIMRIAVLDDNPNDAQFLRTYLKQYEASHNIEFHVDVYAASYDFLEEYQSNYDVIFLDIEMPGSNGIQVAREIRTKDQSVGIVFVTNMAQYAIQGYEVNAIDFMVKPVGYFNFARKLEKAISFVKKREERYLLLANEEGLSKISVEEIYYIEKNGNYAHYVTRRGEYVERGTIQSVKEKLNGLPFSECNSGCLVNLRYVERIGKDSIQVGKWELPLSRRMRKLFTVDYVDFVGGGI
ncbi:MAG: LytR/AlgR family response regulator transcription factor [Faecousia sp.]